MDRNNSWVPFPGISEGGAIGTHRSNVHVRPARTQPVQLLILDHDEPMRESLQAMLQKQGYAVKAVSAAKEALSLLAGYSFDVVLCDLFSPKEKGSEFLREVKQQYPDLPVILLIGHNHANLAGQAMRLGANDYIIRPCHCAEIMVLIDRNVTRRLLQQKHAQEYRMALDVSHENVLDTLLTALNTRGVEGEGHAERVTGYAMELADRMGLSASQKYSVERGALLHDIGMMGIPDRILCKPGNLAPEEWSEIRKHPMIGYQMCARIESLQQAAQIVLHHHEAWDGSGYPNRLVGQEIVLGSRIFAVADTLDAMTTDRPYREAMPFTTAGEKIIQLRGKQFDPAVVDLFLSIPETRWNYIRARAGR